MLLPWITFLSLGFLAGTLSGQDTDPVTYQCWNHENLPLKDPNPLVYCSILPDNFTICPEKLLYDSKNMMDLMFVKNINVKNLNNAYKDVCLKLDKMNGLDKENFTCYSRVKTCLYQYAQKPPKNCLNDMIPCFFETVRTCSPKGAMIFSKALTMIKSTACTLSSKQYKLRPFYGPESHCYPKLRKMSETAAAKLGSNYKQFCAEFDKENVSQCIEDTLLADSSSYNLDNNYIEEAKEFFRRRSELCENFSHSTLQTCPSVDVISCQQDLFEKDALQKTSDVLLRSYANCVYDKYKICDPTLAKIIKYNLDGIKSDAAQ